MLDWFYEHFGTSVTTALHLFILLVIIVMTKNMIVELKSDDDTYKSRFIVLALATYLVCGCVYYIEKQAMRDYAVRTFGEEYVITHRIQIFLTELTSKWLNGVDGISTPNVTEYEIFLTGRTAQI